MENQGKDSTAATLQHIMIIRDFLGYACEELQERGRLHDQSKMSNTEKEGFDKYSPKLKGATYGSEEYFKCLKGLNVALAHHYAHNRHHPEWGSSRLGEKSTTPSIKWMNLIDLVEMMIDWYASTKRHDDGDISRSIELNQKRFGYSDELKEILHNTVEWLKATEMRHNNPWTSHRDPQHEAVAFCNCESKHITSDEGTNRCIKCSRPLAPAIDLSNE